MSCERSVATSRFSEILVGSGKRSTSDRAVAAPHLAPRAASPRSRETTQPDRSGAGQPTTQTTHDPPTPAQTPQKNSPPGGLPTHRQSQNSHFIQSTQNTNSPRTASPDPQGIVRATAIGWAQFFLAWAATDGAAGAIAAKSCSAPRGRAHPPAAQRSPARRRRIVSNRCASSRSNPRGTG